MRYRDLGSRHFQVSVFVLLSLFITPRTDATPLLALKEADNCAACHKPGRSQRPFLLRRCNLDCQGCHIDPAGAGPRNQWGKYYTHTDAGVAMINFYQPEDPLKDRSIWDAHFDGRVIRRDANGSSRVFPMSAEFAFRLRPLVEYLHLTYQPVLLGKIDDDRFRIVREGDRGFREKYSVMVDQIPLNTYVKASRGTPMYGIRRPNHTLWIRERIGLDPFAITDAIEVGSAPNVPYFRASYMSGDPYVSASLRQKGMSYHGGFRGVTLGWHLNASGWQTASDIAQINMNAFGAGLNVFGLILYAEKNDRKVDYTDEFQAKIDSGEQSMGAANRVHPSSTITEYTAALAFIPGIMVGAVYETLKDDDRDSQRKNAFIDLHIIPNLQLEYWRRIETGSRDLTDSLAIAHWYFDF